MSNLSDFHLGFQRAFFTGGSPLLSTSSTVFSLWCRRPQNMAYLSIQNVELQEGDTYLVEGSLLLRNRSRLWSNHGFNRTRLFRQRRARRDPFLRSGGTMLFMKGRWVASTGTLCMGGCFTQNMMGEPNERHDCEVKAVFQYPLQYNISQPLVKGLLESKREERESLFFEPVSITAIPDAPYVFKKDGVCLSPLRADLPGNINAWKYEMAVCQFPWYKQPLSVEWSKQCNGQDCGPFEWLLSSSHVTLSIQNMVCERGKARGYFIFNYQANSVGVTSEVFTVEGSWNSSTGQFCASACYVKGAVNGSMMALDSSDCDIIVTLQFPTTLNLLFRYSVVGHIGRREGSMLSYFHPLSFTGHMDMIYGAFGWGRSPPQLEYEYTAERIAQARSGCEADSSGKLKKRRKGNKTKLRYPDGGVFSDLGFQASLTESSGSRETAYFAPLAINKRTDMYFYTSMPETMSTATSKQKLQRLNVSFDVNVLSSGGGLKLFQNTTFPARFPAEGVYNAKTGVLCLSACRTLDLSRALSAKLSGDDKDCEMLVTVQYPAMNRGYFEQDHISGQILSLREQTDTLYFGPVNLLSAPIFYQEQAAKSLVQTDLEIVMGIISLTMAVLFIGLQLRHVRKNPEVLAHMSLLMLIVLTLGHLIPLILNFEAIFSSRSRQNILQWSGGWLEMYEVLVRLMTMLVFLLLIRLLHLSWSSKCQVSSSEGPWHMEKGIMHACLALYAVAGIIAMVLYGIKGSKFVDVLKALAGLTIDFFLFPQIVANHIWEVHGSVLTFPFYAGMTLVRSLPHLYDIVRKLEFFSSRTMRYYYANPSWDFYSNAWDAIIPFGNLVFAVLVFLQQRYGGACLLTRSYFKKRSYEMVSMTAS